MLVLFWSNTKNSKKMYEPSQNDQELVALTSSEAMKLTTRLMYGFKFTWKLKKALLEQLSVKERRKMSRDDMIIEAGIMKDLDSLVTLFAVRKVLQENADQSPTAFCIPDSTDPKAFTVGAETVLLTTVGSVQGSLANELLKEAKYLFCGEFWESDGEGDGEGDGILSLLREVIEGDHTLKVKEVRERDRSHLVETNRNTNNSRLKVFTNRRSCRYYDHETKRRWTSSICHVKDLRIRTLK